MNLNDLGRYVITSEVLPIGGVKTTVTQLGERNDVGSQVQLSSVQLTGFGKSRHDATKNGIERCLEQIEKFAGRVIRTESVSIAEPTQAEPKFVATLIVGFIDQPKAGEAALLQKKTTAFGSGTTAKEAEDNALANALEILGV